MTDRSHRRSLIPINFMHCSTLVLALPMVLYRIKGYGANLLSITLLPQSREQQPPTNNLQNALVATALRITLVFTQWLLRARSAISWQSTNGGSSVIHCRHLVPLERNGQVNTDRLVSRKPTLKYHPQPRTAGVRKILQTAW